MRPGCVLYHLQWIGLGEEVNAITPANKLSYSAAKEQISESTADNGVRCVVWLHLKPGTVAARDCKRATGREFEFMNVAAAIAKFLCEGLRRKRFPSSQATPNEVPVTSKKKMGMIHSSFNFSGERKNATLEKRRQGVKKLTLRTFSCFCVSLSSMPRRART